MLSNNYENIMIAGDEYDVYFNDVMPYPINNKTDNIEIIIEFPNEFYDCEEINQCKQIIIYDQNERVCDPEPEYQQNPLFIYAVNYNILRIMSGMAGLCYLT